MMGFVKLFIPVLRCGFAIIYRFDWKVYNSMVGNVCWESCASFVEYFEIGS